MVAVLVLLLLLLFTISLAMASLITTFLLWAARVADLRLNLRLDRVLLAVVVFTLPATLSHPLETSLFGKDTFMIIILELIPLTLFLEKFP